MTVRFCKLLVYNQGVGVGARSQLQLVPHRADRMCGTSWIDFNQQLIGPYSYRTILDYTPTDRQTDG